MAALRGASGPLPDAAPALTHPEAHGAEQWQRCLESLIADGLAIRDGAGRISLP